MAAAACAVRPSLENQSKHEKSDSEKDDVEQPNYDMTLYKSRKPLIHSLPSVLIPSLKSIIVDYISHLQLALRALVSQFFDSPIGHFNAIEDAIGVRWKTAVNDEDHVSDVMDRLKKANPKYYLGARYRVDKYNTEENRLKDIMKFAPSIVYAKPMEYQLWNDSDPGHQNSTCVHFRMVCDYNENADDTKQTEAQTGSYTFDSDEDQHDGFHAKPRSKISVQKAMTTLDRALSTILWRDEHLNKECADRYGNSCFSMVGNSQMIASKVPLQLRWGHLEPELMSWRNRRRLYRTLAYKALRKHLLAVLQRAEMKKEIEIAYCNKGELAPLDDHACETPEELVDIRIRCKKSGACLLRIYATEVRDNCAGC